MKAKDVRIGGVYVAKISGKLTRVRMMGTCMYGGWNAKNLETGRLVRIKTAAKLRYESRPKPIPPSDVRPFEPDDSGVER
jgi:hypothetical protein